MSDNSPYLCSLLWLWRRKRCKHRDCEWRLHGDNIFVRGFSRNLWIHQETLATCWINMGPSFSPPLCGQVDSWSRCQGKLAFWKMLSALKLCRFDGNAPSKKFSEDTTTWPCINSKCVSYRTQKNLRGSIPAKQDIRPELQLCGVRSTFQRVAT